ncbi:glycine cleavage system H-protein subunit [Aspergillus hancockii]|nr:glycine cleavage system H-protein subunit [Aspergillus hancockii]
MSAVARSIRPFASRVLSQKLPLAGVRRVSPAAGFPRGSMRSFSQSPFLEVKKYTESHEWIELADNGKTAKIGITEYAAKSLGDVVFVELPEVGLEVSAGEPVGAVESVKSASDVLSPVAGTVIQGNKILDDKAKFINESPEGDAWIAEIEVSDAAELDGLLDAKAYKETIDDE